MAEKHNVEWKEVWKDEYLNWICGFANAQGGTIYIGIDDSGNISGLKNSKKLLEDIPNKIKNAMGIVADINLEESEKGEYIKIKVNPYTFPVSCNGKYYYRSGSTNQHLTGLALDEFMLKKQGVTWDGVPVPGEKIENLDQTAIQLFKKKALESHRLDNKALSVSDEILFQNLGLTDGKYLKKAAVLLFAENPEMWIQGAYIKIGYFGSSDSELIYQDEIHGPLIKQIDSAVELLYTKYLKALIDYDGIQRTETYMLPKEACREILLNAVNHKDYSKGVPIQISVYDDKIYIWNDGKFPEMLSADNIYEKHSSIPYNPKVADVLFKAGMIESWGRGFDKIKEECEANNTPLPEYEISERGIMVLCKPGEKYLKLLKKYGLGTKEENVTDNVTDVRLIKILKLSENSKKTVRMLGIIEMIKKDENISVTEMAESLGVTTRTIKRDIDYLKEMKVVKREGTAKSGKWIISIE